MNDAITSKLLGHRQKLLAYVWFDRTGYNVDIQANAKEFGIRPTTLEEWASRQNWN